MAFFIIKLAVGLFLLLMVGVTFHYIRMFYNIKKEIEQEDNDTEHREFDDWDSF